MNPKKLQLNVHIVGGVSDPGHGQDAAEAEDQALMTLPVSRSLPTVYRMVAQLILAGVASWTPVLVEQFHPHCLATPVWMERTNQSLKNPRLFRIGKPIRHQGLFIIFEELL